MLDDLLAPDSEPDSEWDSDDSDITPRTRNRRKVKERLRIEKASEKARLELLNRPSNAEVWANYLDKHEPVVFFPEAAKRVQAHAAKGLTRLVFPDGSEYHGPAIGIKPQGQGVMTWPDGGSYSGPWRNGLPHTTGNETGIREYANGEQYIGEWRYGRRHGFGKMFASPRENEEQKTDNVSRRSVLFEGQFRDGNKAFQAESKNNVIRPDHSERDLLRKSMVGLENIGAQADAMVEKMLHNAASMPRSPVRHYTSSTRENKKFSASSEKLPVFKAEDSQNNVAAHDNAGHVSAYYVKKEKLRKIKNGWHAYPREKVVGSLRNIAEAKVSLAIKKSYAKVVKQKKRIDKEMSLEMNVRKIIYVRERQNILSDYDKGLSLLKEKYTKQKASTLRLGHQRGGSAIQRAQIEVLRLKKKFMENHGKMMERRARAVKLIKSEYFDDIQEKQHENRARNAQAKLKHLRMAWAKESLVNQQEKKDEAREFASERRRKNEIAQSKRIREAMKLGGTNVKSEDDFLDNDGSKARHMYTLSALHKVIRPSLLSELRLALTQWRKYTMYKRNEESIRHKLNC